MKKLAGLLCALALLCSFCLPVFADNNDNTVKITTTVPSTHTITVAQADGAAVFCNGQPGTTFTVERLSQPQLLVRPDSGRVLTRLLVNGADVTGSVQGGYYTLPAVYEDLTLQVETDAAPQTTTPSPQTTTPPAQATTPPAQATTPPAQATTPPAQTATSSAQTTTSSAQTTTSSAQTAAPPAQTTASPTQTAAPTFRIPQTGDAARPALLLVLALCSAVLFVLLWHKKGKE